MTVHRVRTELAWINQFLFRELELVDQFLKKRTGHLNQFLNQFLHQFSKKELVARTSSRKRDWSLDPVLGKRNWSLDPVLEKRTGHWTQFSEKNQFEELGTVTGLVRKEPVRRTGNCHRSSQKRTSSKNWELSQV